MSGLIRFLTSVVSIMLTVNQLFAAGFIKCEDLLVRDKALKARAPLTDHEKVSGSDELYPISPRIPSGGPIGLEHIQSLSKDVFVKLVGRPLKIESPGISAEKALLLQTPASFLNRLALNDLQLSDSQLMLLIPVDRNFGAEKGKQLMTALLKAGQRKNAHPGFSIEARTSWYTDYFVYKTANEYQIGLIKEGSLIKKHFPLESSGSILAKQQYFLFSIPDTAYGERLLTELVKSGSVEIMEPPAADSFVQAASKKNFEPLTEGPSVFAFPLQGKILPAHFVRNSLSQGSSVGLSVEIGVGDFSVARLAFLELVKRHRIARGNVSEERGRVFVEILPDGSLEMSMGNELIGKKYFSAKAYRLNLSGPVVLRIEATGLVNREMAEYDLVEAIFGSGTPVPLSTVGESFTASGRRRTESRVSDLAQVTVQAAYEDWSVRNLTESAVQRKFHSLFNKKFPLNKGRMGVSLMPPIVSLNELALYRLIAREGLSRTSDLSKKSGASVDFLNQLTEISRIIKELSLTQTDFVESLVYFEDTQNSFAFRGRTWATTESVRQWTYTQNADLDDVKNFKHLPVDRQRYQNYQNTAVWFDVLDGQNRVVGRVQGIVLGAVDPASWSRLLVRTSDGALAVTNVPNSEDVHLGQMFF